MTEEVFFWLVPVWFCWHLSISIWQRCQRGHRPTGFELGCACAAAYVGWEYGSSLFAAGGLLVLVPAALFTLALSPVLAFWYYGHDGALRQRTFQELSCAVFFLALSLASWAFLTSALEDTILVAGIATLFFWQGVPRLRRRWALFRLRRRQRRQEHVTNGETILPSRPEDQRLIAELQEQVTRAEREKEEHELALEHLREQHDSRHEELEEARHEIMVQVRRIRSAQRQALEQGHIGLSYHASSTGFLMAEAARVLRAELKAGERVPAIETDAYLFDVVERLIEPNDFLDRYFHRHGAKAIAAVQRYLAGDEPLSSVREILEALDLEPEDLAPEPLVEPLSETLLESWLEPHRVFQRQQWRLFIDKRHPHQAVLSDFLRTHGLEMPGEQAWTNCWDEFPGVFSPGTRLPLGHHRHLEQKTSPRRATERAPFLQWLAKSWPS